MAAEAFLTIYYIEYISQKDLKNTTLDKNHKNFMVYIAFLTSSNQSLEISINSFYKAQLALFIANKAFIAIPSKYSYNADMFSIKSTKELLEYTKINKYPIDLVED